MRTFVFRVSVTVSVRVRVRLSVMVRVRVSVRVWPTVPPRSRCSAPRDRPAGSCG